MKKQFFAKPAGEITSVHNPKVKLWSQLLTKRGRESQGKFLLEGTHLIQEALKADIELEAVLYSQERGYPKELEDPDLLPCDCIAVSEAVLAKCADTQTPQGVVAIAVKPKWQVAEILEQPNALVMVIDSVQDPGNLGTIIRSADAVGASAVVIGHGTVDLYNPKAVRSTMGSLFHLPIVEADLLELLPTAIDKGIQIISTSLQAKEHCYEIDMTPSTWFIVGNEGNGVSPQLQSFVTQQIIIPMRGQAESINVAMAATVLLFEAARQRHFGRGS
jgi:TrmH family RNA methyltransferase